MMKLFRFLKLLFRPIKKFDSFVGDSLDLMKGSFLEKVFHGMKDTDGKDRAIQAVGKDTYRLHIKSVQPSYYVCYAELLIMDKKTKKYSWQARTQERRILKKDFHKTLINGKLKKI